MGRMLTSIAAALALQAGLAVCASVANAQTPRGGGAASAQMLQELQQLAAERTQWQADSAKMKQELDGLRKERDELKRNRESMEQRSRAAAAALVQSTRERSATERELAESKAKMQELIAKFRETLQTLRQIEAENVAAKQNLTARDRQLAACGGRNAALYSLNGEILTHMERESAWSGLARAEPFTQIARARLENMADDYKARADSERVRPTLPQANPPSSAAAISPPRSVLPAQGPKPKPGPGR